MMLGRRRKLKAWHVLPPSSATSPQECGRIAWRLRRLRSGPTFHAQRSTPMLRIVTSVALLSSALLVSGSRERSGPPAPETMFRGGPAHQGVYQGGGPTLLGLAWRAPTDGDVVSSAAIANGVVYVGSGDGFLYALDLATGARRWRYDAGSPVSSSPAVGRGLVYAEARDGSIFALDGATGPRRRRLTTGPGPPLPWGPESGGPLLSSPTHAG